MNKAQILQKGSDEYQRMGQDEVEQFNPILGALEHPESKKKAIADFCCHCHGGTREEVPDPAWRELIRTCTSPACPLYLHRPYK